MAESKVPELSQPTLSPGESIEAFLGDRTMSARGVDVSGYGGWAAYRAKRP